MMCGRSKHNASCKIFPLIICKLSSFYPDLKAERCQQWEYRVKSYQPLILCLCVIRARYEHDVERRVWSCQRNVIWGRGTGTTCDRLPHTQLQEASCVEEKQLDVAISFLFLWWWKMQFSLHIWQVWKCSPYMASLLPHHCGWNKIWFGTNTCLK